MRTSLILIVFFLLGFGALGQVSPTTSPTRQPTTRSPTTHAPTPSSNCPDDPTDRDGDGFSDCKDKCPDDFNKQTPGICGCGTPDTLVDRDRNGIPECQNGAQPVMTGYGFAAASTAVLSNSVVSAILVVGILAFAA